MVKNIFILVILLFFSSINYALTVKENFTYEIKGVNEAQLANINDRISQVRKNYTTVIPYPQIMRLHQIIKKEIKLALQPFGYYKPTIHSTLKKTSNHWTASYDIVLGKPMQISKLTVSIEGQGQDNSSINNYLNCLPLKVTDICDVIKYNKVKTTLFTLAKNQGYLRVYFDNKILANIKKNTCDINIHLHTGPRFYFGHIIFENYPYTTHFMQRFIQVRPGEVFSSERLIQNQQEMEKSYYFKTAVLRPDFPKQKDYSVPIRANLTSPKAHKYLLGLGYNTLTGPRISAGMEFRHIGYEGHHFESNLDLSSVVSGIGGTYYIPGRRPLSELWHIGMNYKHFHPKKGISNSITTGLGYSNKYNHWVNTIDLNYLVEWFHIHRESAQFSKLLYPRWKLAYVVADNIFEPKNAYSVNLVVQAGLQSVLSTTNFFQPSLGLKYLLTPFGRSRFIFRSDLGYINVGDLRAFPLSLRYFAGGMNSIRGFALNRIGPGKYLGTGTIEYQQHIKGQWYAALFYDAGFATNKFPLKPSRSAGAGAVYDSPAGPIKIYVAHAFTQHGKGISLEFSIGPEFT